MALKVKRNHGKFFQVHKEHRGHRRRQLDGEDMGKSNLLKKEVAMAKIYQINCFALELSGGWWTNVRNGHTFPEGNQRNIEIRKLRIDSRKKAGEASVQDKHT